MVLNKKKDPESPDPELDPKEILNCYRSDGSRLGTPLHP